MNRVAKSTVQQWGNSLAVRIPNPKTTLAQKLATFVPELHGGEAMPTGPAGREIV